MTEKINDQELDKNLVVATTVEAEGLCLHDVRRQPFRIYGLYDPENEKEFKRMPTEVAKEVNSGVKNLHRNTAGGRVRFSTDSPYIVIKAVMPAVSHFSHMPLTCSAGFDIYRDTPDGSSSFYVGTFVPPYDMTDGYESKLTDEGEGIKYFTLNFPLYNRVTDLYIGVKEGSYLGEGAPYRLLDPIVYYGSSITQGGCASRPGNCYQHHVTRALGIDHINLGFSGNGLGEKNMAEYMASLKMCAFVSDYDHNAPTVEHLEATHRRLYDIIRAAHPDIPYVMMSKPDFYWNKYYVNSREESVARRRVILDTYHYAVANGDKNVYFIDGESIFRGPFEDSCTVDGCHPNDLGFAFMAEAVTAVLKRALFDKKR